MDNEEKVAIAYGFAVEALQEATKFDFNVQIGEPITASISISKEKFSEKLNALLKENGFEAEFKFRE